MVTRTKESALSQRSLIFAFAVPSSTLETVAFLSWFLIDATFVTSAVCVACRGRRGIVASRISSIFVVQTPPQAIQAIGGGTIVLYCLYKRLVVIVLQLELLELPCLRSIANIAKSLDLP